MFLVSAYNEDMLAAPVFVAAYTTGMLLQRAFQILPNNCGALQNRNKTVFRPLSVGCQRMFNSHFDACFGACQGLLSWVAIWFSPIVT